MPPEDRRLSALERRLQRLQRTDDAARPDFTRYELDPAGFANDVLGMASATRRSDGSPYQFDVMGSVATHPRTAVVAAHGVGKTRLDAAVALWGLCTVPMARVVIVTPTERQLRFVFGEMARLVRRARVPLPVTVLKTRAVVNGYEAEWLAEGMPATDPTRIEGQHSESRLVLILDECKGVPQVVFDALLGALTGNDARLLVTSTPGGRAGPFYRACTDTRGLWNVVQLSGEDSSLVSPQWCADRAAEWGVASPLYQARVRGEFADEGEGVLFPLSLLERAVLAAPEPSGGVVLGVDCARSISGDLNALAVVRNGRVENIALWRSPDLMVTVQRVVHEALTRSPRLVVVDAGGVGAGVADRLRQLRLPVQAVHFGGSARDVSRFANLRAEMFWRLREAMENDRLALPDDDELAADLTAMRYKFRDDGRVLLRPKDEIRTTLGRSPDRADAVALAAFGALHGSGVPLRRIAPITTPSASPYTGLPDAGGDAFDPDSYRAGGY